MFKYIIDLNGKRKKVNRKEAIKNFKHLVYIKYKPSKRIKVTLK